MKTIQITLAFSILIHGLFLSIPSVKSEPASGKKVVVRLSRRLSPSAASSADQRPQEIPPKQIAPAPPPRQKLERPKETLRADPEPKTGPELQPKDEAPEPISQDRSVETEAFEPVETTDTEMTSLASEFASVGPPSPTPVPADSISNEAATGPDPLQSTEDLPVVPSPAGNAWLTHLLWERVNALKRYPYLARRNGWEGQVVIRVVVGKDGNLLRAEIDQSSGHPTLDEDALSLIRRAMPIKIEASPSWDSATILIPVVYRFRG